MTRRKNPHAVALGRRGGSAATEPQAEAARANGRLGGRPRLTHYACSVCDQAIARGEPGWEDWACPDHPLSRVESVRV